MLNTLVAIVNLLEDFLLLLFGDDNPILEQQQIVMYRKLTFIFPVRLSSIR